MPTRTTVVVPSEAAGARLDRFLAGLELDEDLDAALAGLSRARIQKLCDAGAVTLDGAAARRSHTLRGGERIEVLLPDPEPSCLVPEPLPLSILFEDEHLVAVDKPAGLVVHPGAGHPRGTLVHALLAHCRDLAGIGGALRPGIVHRLDRETSGVLVVAKHDAAHQALAAQFAGRQVHKLYVAFVLGTPAPASGTIDTFYGRHPRHRTRFTSRLASGKRAVTRYAVRAAAGGVSELRVELLTGRTHQIRVHLSERGHPVLGDREYGGQAFARVVVPELREVASALERHALHAARLELCHPASGAPMVLEAPLPPALAALAAWMAPLRPL